MGCSVDDGETEEEQVRDGRVAERIEKGLCGMMRCMVRYLVVWELYRLLGMDLVGI